jgi:rare lipoprotein A
MASWYGQDFHGKPTASGEIYDMYEFTAAHPTFPFGTVVRVENLRNGRTVVVRINDRGPFRSGRIIDLSYAAAVRLDMIRDGVVPVRIEPLK